MNFLASARNNVLYLYTPMKIGTRQGILSDQSVLTRCADQQAVPFNKLNLAARSGARISRPQKAAYMFQNLPISMAQQDSLIEDFILRSQKQEPLAPIARTYSTLSLDKVDALVRQVATQTDGGLARNLANDLIAALRPSSAASNESVSVLTSQPGSPTDQPDEQNLVTPNRPTQGASSSTAPTTSQIPLSERLRRRHGSEGLEHMDRTLEILRRH